MNEVPSSVSSNKVAGSEPPGRPLNTWRKCLKEKLASLYVNEEKARDKQKAILEYPS